MPIQPGDRFLTRDQVATKSAAITVGGKFKAANGYASKSGTISAGDRFVNIRNPDGTQYAHKTGVGQSIPHYIYSVSGTQLYKIRTDTLERVLSVTVTDGLWRLRGLSRSGNYLYYSHEWNLSTIYYGTVTRINVSDLSGEIYVFNVGNRYIGACADDTYFYNANLVYSGGYGGINKFNQSDLSLVQSVSLGLTPTAVTTANGFLWTCNRNENIYKLNCSDLSVVDTYAISAWGICTDGQYLYTVNDSSAIEKRDINDLSIISSTTHGTNNFYICTLRGILYVYDRTGGHITALNHSDLSVILEDPNGGYLYFVGA